MNKKKKAYKRKGETKVGLEKKKLRLEIRELERPWYMKPSYITLFVSMIGILLTYFLSVRPIQKERLEIEKKAIEEVRKKEINQLSSQIRFETLDKVQSATISLLNYGEDGKIVLNDKIVYSDNEVKKQMIEALIRTNKRATEILILALKDKNLDIRMEAGSALGEIGDPKAVDPLIEALKDTDEYVRGKIAYVLGKIGDPKAVDPLIKSLKDTDHVRNQAAEALGEIGDERAVKPLIEALNSPYHSTYYYPAVALGELGEKSVDLLIRALMDSEVFIRRRAADILGEIRDKRAVEPLIEALKDYDDLVRVEATESLCKIPDPKAVDPLIEALNDSHYEVQAFAAQALGIIGDKKAVEPLKRLLEKDDIIARIAESAHWALKKIQKEE